MTSFVYEDKMLTWEGTCCQGMKCYGRDRGSAILGTTGTVVMDRDGYESYDLKGNKKNEFKAGGRKSSADLRGADSMTDRPCANFVAGIPEGDNVHPLVV